MSLSLHHRNIQIILKLSKMESLIGKDFKAFRQVEIKHERGTDFVEAAGTVIKETKTRVFLKGRMYNFNMSKKDFIKYNKFSN